MPAGCSRTSPITWASLAARRQAQRIERGVGVLRRDHRQKLAFVGDVQRIEAEQLAGAAHRVAHRNLIFEEDHAQPAVARQFVQAMSPTPPRVGSRIQRMPGPAASNQRFDQRQHGARIGAKVGFEIELAARQQNGDAVIADRAGEQNLVADAHRARIDGHAMESGGRCRWW